MSTVLRASGRDFDVDAFVAGCGWRVAKVVRRGDPVLPATRPDGRRHDASGLNVAIASEEGDAGPLRPLAEQVDDAVAFLTAHAAEVRRLVTFPGVTTVLLDFGVAWRGDAAAAQSNHFPANLVRAAAGCGVALELTHYRVAEEDEHDDNPPAARRTP